MKDTEVDLPHLPNGWNWAELNEFSEIVLGQSPPSSTYNEDHIGLPFYQGKLEFSSVYPTPRKWCSVPKKIAEKGDVLISVRAPVGPTNICPEKSCIGRGLAAIRGMGGIKPFFLLYLIRSVEKTLSKAGTGTTFDAINGDQLKQLRLPLAPLPEQRRIVVHIEELFSRLDAGVEALQRAKAQLRRYRQAVLKAAVEGRLTEEWRKAHPEVEPASTLLKRIGTKSAGFRQLNFENDAIIEHPNLPESWVWTSIGRIFDVYVGATPRRNTPEYWGGDIPWVSSGEVAFCRIYKTRETISQHGFEKSSTKIHPPGTVLLGMIGEGKTRGQAAILEIAACNNQNSAAVRVSEVGFPAEYVYYYFEHEYERTRKLSSGNNQPALNKNRVQSMYLPLPPLVEQQKIVEEIERCVSITGVIEKTINESLQRANRFRQSILKRAFEGMLIPQDPGDEPASVLLERIEAERAKAAPKNGKKNSSISARQMRLTQ